MTEQQLQEYSVRELIKLGRAANLAKTGNPTFGVDPFQSGWKKPEIVRYLAGRYNAQELSAARAAISRSIATDSAQAGSNFSHVNPSPNQDENSQSGGESSQTEQTDADAQANGDTPQDGESDGDADADAQSDEDADADADESQDADEADADESQDGESDTDGDGDEADADKTDEKKAREKALEKTLEAMATVAQVKMKTDKQKHLLELPQFINAQPVPQVSLKDEHPLFAKILMLLSLPAEYRMPIALVGPAGSGKTRLGKRLAAAFKTFFFSIGCTASMSEAKLEGALRPTGTNGAWLWQQTGFVRCVESGGLALIDEADAADANVLTITHTPASNGYMTIQARTANGLDAEIACHADFRLIISMNTYGLGADAMYVGRAQLDAAFLDRFVILYFGYDMRVFAKMLWAKEPRVRLWTPTADFDEANVKTDCQLLHAWITEIVCPLVAKYNLQKVTSYRMCQKARALRLIGCQVAEIQSDLLAGWKEAERKEIDAATLQFNQEKQVA